MVSEKHKKLPSKLASHQPKRLTKLERIKKEKEKRRMEKKAKQKAKIETEEQLNPMEQDEQGFSRSPPI
jgi:hypothetical protein